tara:strand:+ start:258 stop:380 length:123 start_codon:yes stop_codon:yes gene_type:complete
LYKSITYNFYAYIIEHVFLGFRVGGGGGGVGGGGVGDKLI